MTDTNNPLITLEPKYQEIIRDWQALWNLEETERTRWLLMTPPWGAPISFPDQFPLTQSRRVWQDYVLSSRGQYVY